MNPWNWFVLTGGIALAIRELVPAWRNLAKRDREWWSGLVWGLLALAIAIVVGVQGCQDATAQAGLLTTQQMEKIIATLGTAPANSPDALSILCLGNWQRTKSNALVGNLNFVLTALGWDVVFPGPNGWGDAPQPQHTGVIVYAKERKPTLSKAVQALQTEGVDIRFGGKPDANGDGFDAVFSVGIIE